MESTCNVCGIISPSLFGDGACLQCSKEQEAKAERRKCRQEATRAKGVYRALYAREKLRF